MASVPDSVIIPAGTYYSYFRVTAKDTIGTIQIQATATGYAQAAFNMQVTIPKFQITTTTQRNTTSSRSTLTIYAMDQNGSTHEAAEAVVVTLTTSAPSVASIDSGSVTIPAGQYYTQAASWAPGLVGTAQLSAIDNRAAFYKYQTGTANVAVVTPVSTLSFSTMNLGLGQYSDEYVYVPDYAASSLTVPLVHAATPRTTTPANAVIAAGQYYQTFRITASSAGSDTVTASPPGHVPAKGFSVVGLGRLDPVSNWPAALRVGDSVLVTVYTRDPAQQVRFVAAATTFSLAPNANIQFVSNGSTSTVLTSVVIPVDQTYVAFWVKGVSAGTGSASITNSNYVTYTNTVTVSP